MDIIKELREMKDTIAREIEEANQRIRQSGRDLNAGDVEIIDKLTHSMKSVATTIAMLEAEEDGRYSNGWGQVYGDYRETPGRERRTGYSGNYGSYARNREGRYTREGRTGGYSRGMDWNEHLRQMMDEAPDEATRMDIKKLMDRMAG